MQACIILEAVFITGLLSVCFESARKWEVSGRRPGSGIGGGLGHTRARS